MKYTFTQAEKHFLERNLAYYPEQKQEVWKLFVDAKKKLLDKYKNSHAKPREIVISRNYEILLLVLNRPIDTPCPHDLEETFPTLKDFLQKVSPTTNKIPLYYKGKD